MKTLSLEFGTNLFGKLTPEIKNRLQKVIDNPCQETWDDTYTIILTSSSMKTLWQSVLEIDCNMTKSKGCNDKWNYIPSKEIIITAINNTILGKRNQELN